MLIGNNQPRSFLCLSAGGYHLLGGETPNTCLQPLQHPPALIRGSTLKDNKMNALNQTQQGLTQVRGSERPTYVVGMDAHSRKLAITIYEWIDTWNWTLYGQIPNFLIDAMESTYVQHVPLDSITLIEASSNAFYLKQRLMALGYRAEIVKSDTVSNMEKKRKVCDKKDSENLALAYIQGGIQEFVWMPPEECAQLREVGFAYRDCIKDLTRESNRIWAICNQNGCHFRVVGGRTPADKIRSQLDTISLGWLSRRRLNMIIENYERKLIQRKELECIIAECVIQNSAMLALMQLPGVNYRTAFATVACVGDVHRFSTSNKLVAYAGFAPMLNTSGEEEKRAQKRGGVGKPLDNEGRRDLKFFYAEAAQTVLNSCKGTPLGKWGWRQINSGKPKNKVVCAIARKLIICAWHILREDPTPNRQGEIFYMRKLVRFCGVLGKERIKELGYKNRKDFAIKQANELYANLSEAAPEKMWP